MLREVNKFRLVAYEKDNIANRKELNFTHTDSGKTYLIFIDNVTSKYTQEEFYSKLLEKGAISKEQTEFVICFKEDGKIKQTPVIFNDQKISKIFNEKGEFDIEKYNELASTTFWKFKENVLDVDSKTYDGLKEYEQKNYEGNKCLNGDSNLAKFTRLPYILKELRDCICHRILGVYENFADKTTPRTKECKNYKSNFGHIKELIILENDKCSYRCFRDVYLFMKEINKQKQVSTSKEIEQLKQAKKELLATNTPVEEIDSKNLIYFVRDFIELAKDDEFNEFIWNCKLVTKKVKDATNKLNKSLFDSEVDMSLQRTILEFSGKHPGVINQLIHKFETLHPEKVKQYIIKRP